MLAISKPRGNTVSGHLDYYTQHGLNPVRYEMTNRAWHFQRRASLYRSLGIHPVSIRNARVLEVAVGSGQNSLYLASQRPRHFTLVEPNQVAIRDIKQLYQQAEYAAWRPELFEGTLQEFTAAEPYDLVVCENWLGCNPSERTLLRKLATMVTPGGLLAITVVSPIGFLPNVLRRLLAVRLGCWDRPFADATALLEEAFSSHLATIPAMTRKSTDWIHDNLLNPHYFNICLTLPMVLEDLGDAFTIVGSSPHFAVDWRWFKALYGEARNFNDHFLGEYYRNCHSFLDYRRVLPRGEDAPNRELENAAWTLIETAAAIDQAARTGTTCPEQSQSMFLSQLREIIARVQVFSQDDVLPLREFEQLYRQPQIGSDQVRKMKDFAGLFGRETIYVSLEKNIDF